MASEIRVNKIENRSGLGTVTFADTGVDLAGIVTATTFSGSGASLTSLPAAQVTGTLPAISGANLTNLAAANLTGTIADARFPATLPAASAANLTSIPAANITGTLPALTAANLTNIPAANIVGVATAGFERSGGFGKIIQVSQTTYDTANNITDNSSYQDTGLQASITPTSSSNKILVIVHQTYRLSAASGSAQNGGSIRVIRDSTTISNVQAYLLYNNVSGLSNTMYNYDVYNVQILDSPSTTSSVTYKTKAIVYGAGNGIHLQYAGRSYLTLMEVVA